MNSRPILGLTMGDPAGIGPEICLRALSEPAVLEQCVPVLFGDAGVIASIARTRTSGLARLCEPQCVDKKGSVGISRGSVAEEIAAGHKPGLRVLSLEEWKKNETISEPTIIDCAAIEAATVKPGEVSAACGKAAYVYIEQSIQAALRGQIAGVVTAPIHKEALNLAGIRHPGHTEIFTALTNSQRSCMMLHSDVLTVSMVTTHVGYSDVPGRLSVRRVLDVIELTAQAMQWMLSRPPRLGICGLNPHAGEHGLFGQREEERFIEPAVAQAGKLGIDIRGPLPPDAAFTTSQRKRFDAIVTLYHDQGHIPFKMLAFETGVNITLGLPIVRTSVDHGTAFDIAWKGTAEPQSLFAAIRVATDLVHGRKGAVLK